MNELIGKPDSVESSIPKKTRNHFITVSRGKEVRFRDECEFAKTLIHDSPRLQQCTQPSLFRELLQVAHVGLTLNKVKAHAYLTPRRIKIDNGPGQKPSWENQVVMIPGYRGLVHLATKPGGALSHLHANVVFEGEQFEYIDGTSPSLTHTPNMMLKPDPQKAIGAYCVATLRNGGKVITVMRRDEIELCRQASEGKDSSYSPWKQHWQEMWKKSVIRRAAKTWPDSVLTDEVSQALAIMDQHDPTESGIKPRTEVITEDQALELQLIPSDFEVPGERAISKVLEHYGVTALEMLPAKKFDEAKTKLNTFCEKQAERRNG